MPAPVENALETVRLLTPEKCWSAMSLGSMCNVSEMEEWELQKSVLAEEYGGRNSKSLMDELIMVRCRFSVDNSIP